MRLWRKKNQEFHRFQFWLLLLLYQCWCGGIAWWVTPFRTSFRRILQWYLALKQRAPMDVVVKQLWLVECDLNENSQNIQRFVLLMNVTLLSIMFPQLCTLQPLVSCLLLHVFFLILKRNGSEAQLPKHTAHQLWAWMDASYWSLLFMNIFKL